MGASPKSTDFAIIISISYTRGFSGFLTKYMHNIYIHYIYSIYTYICFKCTHFLKINAGNSLSVYSLVSISVELSWWPRIRYCGTGGFQEQGQWLFTGLASSSLFVSRCFPIINLHSMGWYCGAGVFGLIGCYSHSPILALQTFFNDNNNNWIWQFYATQDHRLTLLITQGHSSRKYAGKTNFRSKWDIINALRDSISIKILLSRGQQIYGNHEFHLSETFRQISITSLVWLCIPLKC